MSQNFDTVVKLLLVFPLAVLANWQMLETWRHGGIFQEIRARLEAKPPVWWVDLLLCTFCLSHWTALGLTLVVFNEFQFPGHYQYMLVPVYSLAVTRLSNACNDLFYKHCRTPKFDIPSLPATETPIDMKDEMQRMREEYYRGQPAGRNEDPNTPTA